MLFPHPNVLWKECVLALILATLAPSDQTSQPVCFQCIEQKTTTSPQIKEIPSHSSTRQGWNHSGLVVGMTKRSVVSFYQNNNVNVTADNC